MAWESLAPSVPKAERGWIHEATFGVLRLRNRLDHHLHQHLHRGVESVPAPLLRVLRLGAYQILQMGSVPPYAAVSQAAGQARALGGPRAAGLVNGVLRALAAAGGDATPFPAFDEDPVGHLTTWGSHPRWLVERWIHRFGAVRAREIVEAGNRIPSLYLRPIGMSVDRALDQLRGRDVDASPGPEGSSTIRLPAGTDPAQLLEMVAGVIQDPAASFVVELVGAAPGDRVADLCAAPGGKGIALAGEGAWVVGLDPSFSRLGRMRDSLRRLELPMRLVAARGERPPLEPFDIVLVDAPCTGTATLARNPDARWRLSPETPAEMAKVQAGILEGAATVVGAGGLLVYSTCTLEPEENEGVVDSFLEAHRDFALEGPEGTLRVFPGSSSTDGAFAVRMRRDQ